jgi:hypothetical protein
MIGFPLSITLLSLIDILSEKITWNLNVWGTDRFLINFILTHKL